MDKSCKSKALKKKMEKKEHSKAEIKGLKKFVKHEEEETEEE